MATAPANILSCAIRGDNRGGRIAIQCGGELSISAIKAEMYIACAEVDRFAPLSMVEALRGKMREAGTKFEIEIYPGTEHGFAFPLRQCFNKAAAERHWERLFALFRRRLG